MWGGGGLYFFGIIFFVGCVFSLQEWSKMKPVKNNSGYLGLYTKDYLQSTVRVSPLVIHMVPNWSFAQLSG